VFMVVGGCLVSRKSVTNKVGVYICNGYVNLL